MGALVGAAAGVLAIAPAAFASPSTYCVNEPACPAGGVIVGSEGAALQEALKKAGETAGSTVLIGPGNYEHTGGFKYEGGTVTIHGAGEFRSLLSDDGANKETVLSVKPTGAGAVALLSGLGVVVPRSKESTGQEETGLRLKAGAHAEHVDVGGGGGVEDVGIDIEKGASFVSGAVLMSETGGEADGVFAEGGELEACAVKGAFAVVAVGKEPLTVRGCLIGASKVGIDAGRAPQGEGSLLAEDSVVDADTASAVGVNVRAETEKVTSATLRGLTIVGGLHGLDVEAAAEKGTTTVASAVLESSVIAETTQASAVVEANAKGHTAHASLLAGYSDTTKGTQAQGHEGGVANVSQESPIELPPLFVNPVPGANGLLEGDWRPAPGSPLIDAGVPEPLKAGEWETDIEGNPRIVHGRRDIGAYEYGFAAPTASASANPTSALTGQSIAFTGSANAVEPGDSIASYSWAFDDGATASGPVVTHAFSTAGTHTATLTAADLLGVQAVVPVTVTVLVQSSPKPPPPTCKCGPLAGPRLTALTLHPSRFRALRHGASVVRTTTPGGALVTFELSGRALVEFTPERLVRGVRKGKRCVAAKHGAHGHPCTRLIPLRSFTRAGRKGSRSFRFSGRVANTALPPGRYELVASVPGSSLEAPFTIVK